MRKVKLNWAIALAIIISFSALTINKQVPDFSGRWTLKSYTLRERVSQAIPPKALDISQQRDLLIITFLFQKTPNDSALVSLHTDSLYTDDRYHATGYITGADTLMVNNAWSADQKGLVRTFKERGQIKRTMVFRMDANNLTLSTIDYDGNSSHESKLIFTKRK